MAKQFRVIFKNRNKSYVISAVDGWVVQEWAQNQIASKGWDENEDYDYDEVE